MDHIANARLALTQCWKCLGCNRLEQPGFRGTNKCNNFRDSDIQLTLDFTPKAAGGTVKAEK